MDLQELKKALESRKEPRFRLAQAKRAFYVDLLTGWDEVTTFSQTLRSELTSLVPWDALREVGSETSKKQDTVKKLFACADGAAIEAVLMRHEAGRNTVCISSQVGCPMGCAFCATGAMGFKRNLTPDEIAEQVIHFSRLLKKTDDRVSNVVFMGMGEPFNNYDHVMAAVRILNDPEGFNLGARHMTISTSGLAPGILKLAQEPLQVNLAVSLHSALEQTRTQLMPVNKAYPIKKLMAAVAEYAEATNRKVMFEYLLLDGVNDDLRHLEALIRLMSENRRLYQVNLIKYHETGKFKASPKDRRDAFMQKLKEAGILVTHRVSFGEDIDAACGQLANKKMRESEQ